MSTELWNEWNFAGTPNYPHEKVVQFCLRHFPAEVRGQTPTLDLGCGSGVNAAFLTSEGFPVTGVDISPIAIENSRRFLATRGLTADLFISSADRIDLSSASFGLVICVGVLDAVGPAIAAGAVGEATRLLSAGGKGLFFFASDCDIRIQGENKYRLHGYSRAEVDSLFATGFEKVWIDRHITTFQGGSYESNNWLVTVQK